jgi:hypothetical protein
MLSQMPRTRSQPTRALNKKIGFRPGRSGACEARLFLFTGQAHGEAEPLVQQTVRAERRARAQDRRHERRGDD